MLKKKKERKKENTDSLSHIPTIISLPLITLPKVSRDWLIIPASFALLFSAPDLPMFSDPARSTKFSFPT